MADWFRIDQLRKWQAARQTTSVQDRELTLLESIVAKDAELESLRQELARKEEALRKITEFESLTFAECSIAEEVIGTAKAALSPQADKELDSLCPKCYGSGLSCSIPGTEEESQCDDCKGTGEADKENPNA